MSFVPSASLTPTARGGGVAPPRRTRFRSRASSSRDALARHPTWRTFNPDESSSGGGRPRAARDFARGVSPLPAPSREAARRRRRRRAARVARSTPGDDDAADCDAPWATDADPGLNADLLSEPGCLSVARRFTRDDEWREYQSPRRYFEQMVTINGSVVARRVTIPALVIAAWSAAVGFASAAFPAVAASVSRAAPFVAVVGGAVSLLLAFRTNAAYARFGRAADSFAEVIAMTRNLSRKMVVWCPVEDRDAHARLVAAIPWSIKHRGQGIEGTDAAREELENVLDAPQLERLDLGSNVPMQIMTEITRGLDAMNERRVELIYQLLMDNDLTALHAQAARTDRLVATPTPVSYSRHISRGLVLWLLALPAVYASACPIWVLAPASLCVAWLLLGIDDIGMQLEQPYTVMSIRQFCQECEEEVKREMGESAWTPRIGKPREDVLESDFLNPEMTEFEKAGKRRRASVSREGGERGAGTSEAKRSRERRAGGETKTREVAIEASVALDSAG